MWDSARVENWGPSIFERKKISSSNPYDSDSDRIDEEFIEILTHTNQSSTHVQSTPPLPQHLLSNLSNNLTQSMVKWLSKSNMTNNPSPKISPRPHPLRPVKNLIRNNEIPWLNLLPQTSYRRKGNHAADTDRS